MISKFFVWSNGLYDLLYKMNLRLTPSAQWMVFSSDFVIFFNWLFCWLIKQIHSSWYFVITDQNNQITFCHFYESAILLIEQTNTSSWYFQIVINYRPEPNIFFFSQNQISFSFLFVSARIKKISWFLISTSNHRW